MNPTVTDKISKKRAKINMKTPKKKEILSFKFKNRWFKIFICSQKTGPPAVLEAYVLEAELGQRQLAKPRILLQAGLG